MYSVFQDTYICQLSLIQCILFPPPDPSPVLHTGKKICVISVQGQTDMIQF